MAGQDPSCMVPKKGGTRGFPGGPAVKTPRFHCRGTRVRSLVGELRSCMARGTAKKKKRKKDEKGGGAGVPGVNL